MTAQTKTNTDNWESIKAKSEAALGEDVVEYINECMEDNNPESHLISVLHKVQAKFGFLSKENLDAVAQLLQVPAAKVTGVATFYHFFCLEERGEFIINICMGTACYVKGADKVATRLKEELGIDFGETTSDGMFSLEASRCIGTCGLAPVLMVGEEVHPQVTPDQIPAIIEHYMDMAKKG